MPRGVGSCCMNIFASVLVLLQLAATLIAGVQNNPSVSEEQKKSATDFANNAISVALQVLAQTPVTTSTVTQPQSNGTGTGTEVISQTHVTEAPTTPIATDTLASAIQVPLSNLARIDWAKDISNQPLRIRFYIEPNANTTRTLSKVRITLNGETKEFAPVQVNNNDMVEFFNVSSETDYTYVARVEFENEFATTMGVVRTSK